MEAKIKMKQIDAALLQKMLIGGAKRLEANKEYINELNVFPVPDGDTGTNMTMTALAAAKEVGNAAEVTASFLSVVCPPIVTFWYIGDPAELNVCDWERTLLIVNVLIQRHVNNSNASSFVIFPSLISFI